MDKDERYISELCAHFDEPTRIREVLQRYCKAASQGRLNKTVDQIFAKVESLVSEIQSGHLHRFGHEHMENELAAMTEEPVRVVGGSVTPKLPPADPEWNVTFDPADADSGDDSCPGFVRDPLIRAPK